MRAQRLGGGGEAGVDGALGADEQDVGHAGGQPGQQRGCVPDHLDPADEGQGDQPGRDVVPDPPALVVHPDGGGAVDRARASVVDHGLLLAPPAGYAVQVRCPAGVRPAGCRSGWGFLLKGTPRRPRALAPALRASPPPGSDAIWIQP